MDCKTLSACRLRWMLVPTTPTAVRRGSVDAAESEPSHQSGRALKTQ